MKGGENVHFRQFLIFALLVGAAMFFPDNAFAEKNELRPQKGQAPASIPEHAPIPEQASAPEAASIPERATIAVPAKSEEAKSLNKTIPEHARENQVQAKQRPAQNQASTEKSLPEQANGNIKSVVKKAENVAQVNVPEQAEATHTVEKLTPNHSFQVTDRKVNVEKVKPETVNDTVYLQAEDVDITISESFVQEPQKEPATKEEIPKGNQVLNQSQRSNSSGGQSNDRVNQGINNLSFLDKWFEWNHYFENKLAQPYLSRLALMNTQWVNAPPAPPLQEAPLFTNVTRS